MAFFGALDFDWLEEDDELLEDDCEELLEEEDEEDKERVLEASLSSPNSSRFILAASATRALAFSSKC